MMRMILMALLANVLWSQPRVAVIAHRGEHLRHPENTLEAFASAAEAGADYIEVDVRTTADGKLVLMHDATVDRMTDGHGEVAAMKLEDLLKLRVGAASRVATFDEALALARGKNMGVYVDSKSVSAADAVQAIERNGMAERVVIYGRESYLLELSAMRPKMRVMPEARDAATLRRLLAAMPLRVVAFDARDFNDETIAVAKAAKVAIYVDRLGAADNAQGWQDAVDRGAAGIQTDHPAELVEYLRKKGYR